MEHRDQDSPNHDIDRQILQLHGTWKSRQEKTDAMTVPPYAPSAKDPHRFIDHFLCGHLEAGGSPEMRWLQ